MGSYGPVFTHTRQRGTGIKGKPYSSNDQTATVAKAPIQSGVSQVSAQPAFLPGRQIFTPLSMGGGKVSRITTRFPFTFWW